MKNFYLNFHMNQEDGQTVQFLNEIEDFEESILLEKNISIKPPIANIFISSPGGENRMAAIIYNFFKKSLFDYQFTINGQFSSNAILILLALNPKYITIMRQCTTIIHLSNYDIPVSTIALNNPTYIGLSEYNDFKNYLNSMAELYKLFLTKEELVIIKQGEDVYLSSKRVAELFQKLKKDKKLQNKAKELFEITL